MSYGGRRGPRRAGVQTSSIASQAGGHAHYGSHGIDHQGMSVEELVTLIQNLSPKERIPDAAFQALFHFDSRATALLLKDLSKASMGARASELFEWLRGLDLSHPLQVHAVVSTLCLKCQDIQPVEPLACVSEPTWKQEALQL